MNREGNIYIDEKVSLLEVNLPIDGQVFRSKVNLDLIPEEDIRIILDRSRSFLQMEQIQLEERTKVTDIEELRRLESVLNAHKAFMIEGIEPVFLSPAVEIVDCLENEEGEIIDKDFLAEWLEGDFLVAWGRFFFFYLENNRVKLKKKSH